VGFAFDLRSEVNHADERKDKLEDFDDFISDAVA
jgi:hypothetical protein